jgi:hypothetical protein
MSPYSTLKSCGSLSILVRRSQRPSLVTRGSARVAWRITLPSSSTCVVRNFTIRNERLLKPLRVWKNKAGPCESNLIKRAVISISGESNSSSEAAPTTSKQRLTNCSVPVTRGSLSSSAQACDASCSSRWRSASSCSSRSRSASSSALACAASRSRRPSRSATTRSAAVRANSCSRRSRSARRRLRRSRV